MLLFRRFTHSHIDLTIISRLLCRNFRRMGLRHLRMATGYHILNMLLQRQHRRQLRYRDSNFFIRLTRLVTQLTLPLQRTHRFFIRTFFRAKGIIIGALTVNFQRLHRFHFIRHLTLTRQHRHSVTNITMRHSFLLRHRTLSSIRNLIMTLIRNTISNAFLLLMKQVLRRHQGDHRRIISRAISIISGHPNNTQ